MPSILIAEDDAGLRQLMTRFLSQCGYETIGVPSAFDALDLMKLRPFDLLLSDVVLLGMDGIELALIVGRDFPQTKIMLISGYEESRQKAVNLESLIHDLLSKPFTLEELRSRVKKVIEKPVH